MRKQRNEKTKQELKVQRNTREREKKGITEMRAGEGGTGRERSNYREQDTLGRKTKEELKLRKEWSNTRERDEKEPRSKTAMKPKNR